MGLLDPDFVQGFTDMDFVLCSRFRPVKGKQDEWRRKVERFTQCQDYEKTYRELTAGLKSFFLNKSSAQKQIFKEHVSKV